MTPKRRLLVWIACVVCALGGPLGAAALKSSPGGWGWGEVLGLLGLTAFLWLLETTPADAIRLPRWLSEVVIAIGAAVLAWVALSDALGALLLGVAARVLVGVRFAIVRDRDRTQSRPNPAAWSPWWATLLVWHPALGQALVEPGRVVIASLATAGVAALAPLGPRRIRVVAWIGWAASLGAWAVWSITAPGSRP
jgi:hypothetical protein